jgi:nicotinic acid mononucleotide adenylyltransferase
MNKKLKHIDKELTNKYLDKHSEVILLSIRFGELSEIKRKVLKAFIEDDDSTMLTIAKKIGDTHVATESVLNELEEDGWLLSIPSRNISKETCWLCGNDNISRFLFWQNWQENVNR